MSAIWDATHDTITVDLATTAFDHLAIGGRPLGVELTPGEAARLADELLGALAERCGPRTRLADLAAGAPGGGEPR